MCINIRGTLVYTNPNGFLIILTFIGFKLMRRFWIQLGLKKRLIIIQKGIKTQAIESIECYVKKTLASVLLISFFMFSVFAANLIIGFLIRGFEVLEPLRNVRKLAIS